jgi:hypothetical protein
MTRRQKITVGVVLVLLVLLYSGAATLGGSGQGATLHPGGLVGWLGHVVGKPPAASRSDESAACLDGDTLTIKGTCTLTVAKSSTKTRQVKIHATDAITITTRAPNSDSTVKQDAKAGADIAVTVDANGADITLSCADTGDTCSATLS